MGNSGYALMQICAKFSKPRPHINCVIKSLAKWGTMAFEGIGSPYIHANIQAGRSTRCKLHLSLIFLFFLLSSCTSNHRSFPYINVMFDKNLFTFSDTDEWKSRECVHDKKRRHCEIFKIYTAKSKGVCVCVCGSVVTRTNPICRLIGATTM